MQLTPKQDQALKDLQEAFGWPSVMVLGTNHTWTRQGSICVNLTPHQMIGLIEVEKHRIMHNDKLFRIDGPTVIDGGQA